MASYLKVSSRTYNWQFINSHRMLKISLSRISRLRPQFVTAWAQFRTRTLFASASTLYDTTDSLSGDRVLLWGLELSRATSGMSGWRGCTATSVLAPHGSVSRVNGVSYVVAFAATELFLSPSICVSPSSLCRSYGVAYADSWTAVSQHIWGCNHVAPETRATENPRCKSKSNVGRCGLINNLNRNILRRMRANKRIPRRQTTNRQLVLVYVMTTPVARTRTAHTSSLLIPMSCWRRRSIATEGVALSPSVHLCCLAAS